MDFTVDGIDVRHMKQANGTHLYLMNAQSGTFMSETYSPRILTDAELAVWVAPVRAAAHRLASAVSEYNAGNAKWAAVNTCAKHRLSGKRDAAV